MKKLLMLLCTTSMLATGCGDQGKGVPQDVVMTGNISGEITVSCYDTMTYKTFLETAAALFEQEYPGTKVNIETLSAMPEMRTSEQNGKTMTMMLKQDDPTATSDYINKINTELMSGGGADIIAADVVPYLNYAHNGQIEDLTKYMSSDTNFKVDDYRTNILDAVKSQNSQYVLPIDYSFSYFAYDSSLMDGSVLDSTTDYTIESLIEVSMSEFQRINADSPQHVYMFGMDDSANKGSMFAALLNENYAEFIDVVAKTVNLTDGRFEEMLDRVKELSEEGIIKKSAASPRQMNMGDLEKAREEKFMFKKMDSMSLMQNFNRNSNIRMVEGGGAGNTDNDKLIGVAADSSGRIPFSYTQGYMINANSNNKETSWAFLKFLLGDEMQTSINLRGLSINNAARAKKAELAVSGELYAQMGAQSTGMDTEKEQILSDYLKTVEEYSDKLNAYAVRDAKLDDIITQEVREFFSGAKDAKQVTAAMQNKVKLYLEE